MLGKWTIGLQTFRDHVTEIVLKDESEAPLNISGWFVKFEVTHDEGTITWSTVSGHVVIASPSTLGKITLTVPKEEMTDVLMPFEWALFSFYAGPDSDNPDLVYKGKISRTS